jgi:hypothetical protein
MEYNLYGIARIMLYLFSFNFYISNKRRQIITQQARSYYSGPGTA